jgi:excisionase family DNA binding protein
VSAPLLTADEAAVLLGVPKSWVMEQARHDRIPHVRLGRYVRFDEDALLEWVSRRQRGPVTMAR